MKARIAHLIISQLAPSPFLLDSRRWTIFANNTAWSEYGAPHNSARSMDCDWWVRCICHDFAVYVLICLSDLGLTYMTVHNGAGLAAWQRNDGCEKTTKSKY